MTPPVDRPDHAERARTLGDVLHSGGPDLGPAEAEWVALVRRIAASDPDALHVLYERAHAPVYTLAFRITGAPTAADDVTVEVFYQVWQRAAGYEAAAGSVLGWIMNQARCRAIDRWRADQRQKRNAVASPVDPIGDGAAHEALQGGERKLLLQAALRVLTAPEQRAIEATYFWRLSYREAAERLGEPEGTVKTRIRAALRKLRLLLGPRRESL